MKGKLKTFEIILSNKSGIFYAGNVIEGHVVVELLEPMKMRGIEIKFFGNCKVHFSRTTGSAANGNQQTQHFLSNESYFDKDILLFGESSEEDSTGTELPSGYHTFPFQFELPGDLPSSFECPSQARVRYQAICTIHKLKKGKSNHRARHLFTVNSVLDLNSKEESFQRVSNSDQKRLCCLCCKSGPIIAEMSVDRQGCVPGESVDLHVDINNGSSRTLNESHVDLRMVATCKINISTFRTERILARVTRPQIPGYGQDTWTGEKLVIPSVPPSFLEGCNIIDIQYFLKLIVTPSGPSEKLEVSLPIIIGNIPLISVLEQTPPRHPDTPYNAGNEPLALAGDLTYLTPLTTTIPNLPPPSYKECVLGQVEAHEIEDNDRTRGNLTYAPAYPFYDWGHTPGELPPQYL